MNDEILSVLKRCAVVVNDHSSSPIDADPDCTRWDVCNGCGEPTWKPHRKGCEIESLLNDLHKLIKKLEN